VKLEALRIVAALLRDAGRAEILPRFRNLAEGTVKMKTGPLDLVTEADEAAELRITEGLR
jgi:fructose-1,6-bisphosphatase/inositol monophosphatase family enzyme